MTDARVLTDQSQFLFVFQGLKGTLTAREVARAGSAVARELRLDFQSVIGSDGGDGLLDALVGSLAATTRHTVSGPSGEPVQADIGWLSDGTAVIESRMACGAPTPRASVTEPVVLDGATLGVGELILEAVAGGAPVVYVGLGGSATMDAGTGMARALGWRFLDQEGLEVPSGGRGLPAIHQVVPGPPCAARVVGLCDVTNVLVGAEGAAVYAPQKGAAASDVGLLRAGVERVSRQIEGWPALAARAGAGAGGGLGFGIMAFLGGTAVSGASWVLEHIDFADALAAAARVVTVEGRFDDTSLQGKLTGTVIELCARRGVPVAVVSAARTALSAAPPGRCHVVAGDGSPVGTPELRALFTRAISAFD